MVLDRIAVVAVFTPDSELSETEKAGDGFADFIDDFEHYRMSVASALNRNIDVAYLDSSATLFLFKGAEHPPVSRKSLSGYGFIIYVPGQAPIIFQGVATDPDVICALQRLAPQVRVSTNSRSRRKRCADRFSTRRARSIPSGHRAGCRC